MLDSSVLDLSVVCQRTGFSPEAFLFVQEGLQHTIRMIHGEAGAEELFAAEDDSRHVSGRQLCVGLRDLALSQYGRLAGVVLAKWGVTGTEDFGRIVFALVEAGLLRKTDEDTIEDFRGVYDFRDAFGAAMPA
ncbi:MAG: hypothetical protein KF684_00835 [Phycisphaeraceae bacterium]|nr:hypothetical protein [Phycisphaeraceae bacterium]